MRVFRALPLLALAGALAFASAPAAGFDVAGDDSISKQRGGGASRGTTATRGTANRSTTNTNRNTNANRNTNTANRNTNVNRNTSVNNTNVNVNRNVNVDGDNYRYGDGDIDRRPVRNALAFGALVRALPGGCPPVMVGGARYYSCGGSWYQSQGSQYVVVAPPQ
jgi:hypothetical protein